MTGDKIDKLASQYVELVIEQGKASEPYGSTTSMNRVIIDRI